MSPSTSPRERFEWWAMISSIRRVLTMTSFTWVSMSLGAPRVQALPRWIMILALSSALRFPLAPPQSPVGAADIPIPMQRVATSQETCCITSWIASSAWARPPGELM